VSRIWRERYDRSRHHNKMYGGVDDGYPPNFDFTPRDNLLVQWAYFVNVCGFDFQFLSLRHLDVCLEYFRKKIHPSRRVDLGAADHWEVQNWHHRLPKGLRREPNRVKIVKALGTSPEGVRSFGGEIQIGNVVSSQDSGIVTIRRGPRESALSSAFAQTTLG
jgi:hypothetical protein